ncbi:MAG: FtsB family cell division protein [Moorellaceae bacterium]
MSARPRQRSLALAAGLPGQIIPVSPAKNRKARRSRFSVLLVCVCLAYLLYSFVHLGLRIHRVEEELMACRQQKAALLEEQARLQEEIRKLESDAYIEKVAREQLGLIKRGETIILTARPAEEEVPAYVPPPPGHEFRD